MVRGAAMQHDRWWVRRKKTHICSSCLFARFLQDNLTGSSSSSSNMFNRRSTSVSRHNYEGSNYVTPTKSIDDYECAFDVPEPKRLRRNLYGFSSPILHWDPHENKKNMFPVNLLPSFEKDMLDLSIKSSNHTRKRFKSFDIVKPGAIYSECTPKHIEGCVREVCPSAASGQNDDDSNTTLVFPTLKRHQAVEAARKRRARSTGRSLCCNACIRVGSSDWIGYTQGDQLTDAFGC
jgi:hypothetical protein